MSTKKRDGRFANRGRRLTFVIFAVIAVAMGVAWLQTTGSRKPTVSKHDAWPNLLNTKSPDELVLGEGSPDDRSGESLRRTVGEASKPLSRDAAARLNRLPLGSIAFNAPVQMTRNKPYDLKVLVTSEAGKTLTDMLSAEFVDKPEVDRLPVSDTMKVELVGADEDFDIQKLIETEQVTSIGYHTDWLFTVVPKTTGYHRLMVVAYVILPTSHGDEPHAFQVFNKTIHVIISEKDKNDEFWAGFRVWISSIGSVVGVITAIVGLLKRNKRAGKEKEGVEEDDDEAKAESPNEQREAVGAGSGSGD